MPNKVLIIEDDVLTATNVATLLDGEGYRSSIAHTSLQAIDLVSKSKPDVIIMDIDLKEEMDGIDLAVSIAKEPNIPVIYLTDREDHRIVKKASKVHHAFYMNKPYKDAVLVSQVELALKQSKGNSDQIKVEALFIKEKANSNQKTKVPYDDIVYLKAGRVYCEIYARKTGKEGVYKLDTCSPLGDIMETLPPQKFMRVHRSYAVNLAFVEALDSKDVVVYDKTSITMGPKYKAGLLERLNMF